MLDGRRSASTFRWRCTAALLFMVMVVLLAIMHWCDREPGARNVIQRQITGFDRKMACRGHRLMVGSLTLLLTIRQG